jgi:hypothetical protein
VCVNAQPPFVMYLVCLLFLLLGIRFATTASASLPQGLTDGARGKHFSTQGGMGVRKDMFSSAVRS